MSFKSSKSSIFSKQLSKYILLLGIYTYVLNTSFGQTNFLDNNPQYKEVLSKANSVKDPSRQVGGFDPNTAPALPLGIVKEINGTKYIICVDSAYFLEDGAYFSAYMAIEFPQANKPIAFAAKNIKFNPNGVKGGEQAKLMLVSEHLIDMGPKTQLKLFGDGSNYVNWGCNGFESVNLHGAFLFSGDLLRPANPSDTVVTAEFEVNVVDLNNMMCQVDFSPFTIRGMEDFEFTISEASVDMSDYLNPPNVTMPQCYYELYPDDIDLWRGFHLRYLEVQMPEKMSSQDEPLAIFVQDLFIDDAGVTGYFGARNILSIGNGKTSGGWGFSVDSLSIGLTTNQLTSGIMTGEIQIPIFDNTALDYAAMISKNEGRGDTEYMFTINPASELSVNAFKSTVLLYPTTQLKMTVVNKKFKPSITMNGKWTLDDAKGSFKGIGFQSLTVISEAPYVSAGIFSLLSDETPKTAKYPVSLTNITMGILNSQVVIGTDVALNLGDTSSTHVSVETGFKVYTKIEQNPYTEKQEWKYDKFKINSIAIDLDVSAVKMKGLINYMDDHPVYGKGFEGGLTIKIADVINEIGMYCIFGKVDSYRYFAIDATLPVHIPLTPDQTLFLTQLSGGISYHMKNKLSVDEIIAVADAPVNGVNPAMTPNYEPNSSYSIGFNAGVAYQHAKEDNLNGNVIFNIQFNTNGGLQSILLAGDAYMMVTREQRATSTNYAKGTIAIGYDNQNKIFDAQMNASAQFSGTLTASIWSQLYISPNLWYFHLGTPSNQCSVNLWNFASANAYFMFGQNLPPMPLPPPQVSSVLGGLQNGRNEGEIANGNGIGCGMNLYVGFNGSKKLKGINWEAYATAYIGAGFDMTLYKYASTTHCEGSTDPFGANYWYLNGQLYAYGGLNAGVRQTNGNLDFTIIQASMAMLLQGKLPKPTYVYGGINLTANVLNLFDVNVTAEFEAGTNCNVIN
jgi:hypothetical protein